MDGPRFAALARPVRTESPAAVSPRPASPLSRRTMLRGLASGAGALAAASVLPRSLGSFSASPVAASAAQSTQIVPVRLGNPAARILLPGEAGLSNFGLDFSLTGPPAVFMSASGTPGWSQELSASVGGFAFGYAATLAETQKAATSGRAVQVCVHHGFSSDNDADVAWSSLTNTLMGRGEARQAKVKAVDLVEIVAVDGPRTIMATVAADRFDAIVVALRAGADLVTVSIADFTGTKPTQDEAVKLAEKEAEKITQPTPERSTVAGAFNGTWTPGFGFGASGAAIAGAPFFAWPTVLGKSPVPFTGESSEQSSQRRETSSGVEYQSHVEGPFTGASVFAEHGLYYSGQTSFFSGSGDAKRFHEETSSRLKIGLPGVKLTKVQVSSKERRYFYKVTTGLGTLSGLILNRIVTDADHPLGFTLHVLAVPTSTETKPPSSSSFRDRCDPMIREMADSLEIALLVPKNAPVTIGINTPV